MSGLILTEENAFFNLFVQTRLAALTGRPTRTASWRRVVALASPVQYKDVERPVGSIPRDTEATALACRRSVSIPATRR
jgi:hypothetical protein